MKKPMRPVTYLLEMRPMDIIEAREMPSSLRIRLGVLWEDRGWLHGFDTIVACIAQTVEARA